MMERLAASSGIDRCKKVLSRCLSEPWFVHNYVRHRQVASCAMDNVTMVSMPADAPLRATSVGSKVAVGQVDSFVRDAMAASSRLECLTALDCQRHGGGAAQQRYRNHAVSGHFLLGGGSGSRRGGSVRAQMVVERWMLWLFAWPFSVRREQEGSCPPLLR